MPVWLSPYGYIYIFFQGTIKAPCFTAGICNFDLKTASMSISPYKLLKIIGLLTGWI